MTVNTMVSDGRYQAYLNPMLATETSYTMSGHGAETQPGGLRINMIPNVEHERHRPCSSDPRGCMPLQIALSPAGENSNLTA